MAMATAAVVASGIASAMPEANAVGWPSNYQGVMLQGFYWDSFADTKWTNLTAQADEYSKYFKLIWVPNSAKAASNGMGYDPVYWFTNHNTPFGTEAQLREMIATYKAKGVGIIEDVVVNHRSGKSNWTDFPAETWRGVTYQLGPEHICCNDEVAYASGQAKPTGAYDTGENFDGSRDLDHTNVTVQNNIKAYCQFLLEDLGYAGFRYDMVKGYSPCYTKIYNESSKPTYSVGEYWDGYDGIAAWIEGTGKQSAAFDFPFKYAVKEAFGSGDMTKLVWKANGTNDQPAGMIHFGYSQYAVTFIDNHDTSRDDWNKFNGNVVAANAFMLCSPGTPCVFLPHYKANKAAIQTLIDIRNACGLHNNSAVRVIRSTSDCYMAEVTGSKGKLVVKIGSAMVSPDGYTNADIKATGTDYCVWTKVNVQGGGIPVEIPTTEYDVYFRNDNAWKTPYIHYWGGTESKWPGVAMTLVAGNVWKYTVPAGTTGILFNAGDGDATKTSDFAAVPNHLYSPSGDEGEYKSGSTSFPAKLYLVGNLPGGHWNTSTAPIAATGVDGVYKWNQVELQEGDPKQPGYAWFSIISAIGADWDAVNSSDRYGAATKDEALADNGSLTYFQANVNASAANSWKVAAGTYNITADLKNMVIAIAKSADGIDTAVAADEETEAVYYNLQGIEVTNPGAGVYFKRQGSKVTKVIVY